MTGFRKALFEYAREKYKTEPEYLWARFPDYAVFRHADNKKWYGIIMDVPRSKLGLQGDGHVDILNVKLEDPLLRDMLLEQEGYLPGYHISRGNWISILLDGTAAFEEVCGMLDLSFTATASKTTKKKVRGKREWIVPANPKYYDIERDLADSDVFEWKQSSDVRVGDTVYIYMAAPVSAILYRCEAIEVDIPYDYRDENLSITRVMKLKLQRRYAPERFTLDILKTEYGIFAVRGPRGVPKSLSHALAESVPEGEN